MGKIKAWYRSIPLWLAIFLFAAAALIVASLVSNKVTSIANHANNQLWIKYAEFGSIQVDDGKATVYFAGGLSSPDNYSEDDFRLYKTNQFLVQYVPFFIYSISLLAAALLIYFTKLKKPLALLLNASAKIAENNFDFSLDYSGHDEMATLCEAFEKMRSSVDENNMRMRQIIEERKQLNDAYTHDLRTPIAVLKGYTGILTKFLPTGQFSQEKVIATVNTMSAHVERLEQFVNSMNTAQKLADLTIRREAITTGDFVNGLRETATLLCKKQNLSCEINSGIETDTLNIDPSAVTQVFENLLGNAARFARTKVSVQLETDGKTLSICVADDGTGFTEKALASAAKPYFSGEQTEETYHFGLGLYICQTLCEKHGGSLKLSNTTNSGASVTAFFTL